MAKSIQRIKAREMRSRGESVIGISRELNISKSTASLWVRDLILSVEQLERLRGNSIKGAELGRLRSALMQKEKRRVLLESSKQEGIKLLNNLTPREFLIAGLALYWGEGAKTREVEFCNSDPVLIRFMISWIKKCFKIENSDLSCYVGINELHRSREKLVMGYWSKETKIPLTQFRKTSFKKVKNKKVYANFNEHYGTLSVKVLKPARIYYKIIGEIEGLAVNGLSDTGEIIK